MNLTTQLAKHLRDVHFGGNWTTSNLKDNLADISWRQAIGKIYWIRPLQMLKLSLY